MVGHLLNDTKTFQQQNSNLFWPNQLEISSRIFHYNLASESGMGILAKLSCITWKKCLIIILVLMLNITSKMIFLQFKIWNRNRGLFRNPFFLFLQPPTPDETFFLHSDQTRGGKKEKKKMLRMANGAVFCAEMMECGNLRNWPSWWWFRPPANGQPFYAEDFEITISTDVRRTFGNAAVELNFAFFSANDD